MELFTKQGHDCHAVDLRGHGGSQGDLMTAHLRDFITDARQAVAAMSEPPILIGHSLGGVLVEHLLSADTYPAAVLVASVPGRYPVSTLLRTAVTRPGATLQTVVRRDLLPLVATTDGARQFLFGPTADNESVRQVQARLISAAPHVIRELALTRPARPRPGTPILVLAATHDATFRPAAQRRRARSIGANYREVEGSGHDIPLDHAGKDAAAVVVNWLSVVG